MDNTKIRWCERTHNPFVGCTKISPGCDHCYAETITQKWPGNFKNSDGDLVGFTPTFKPGKVNEPRGWRVSSRVFCNSMSDPFHKDFTDEQRDLVFDVYLQTPKHDYLILTKRPQLMANYFNGPGGYLARRGLERLPAHMWVGTSIESDKYTFRARHLAAIPAVVHFLSVEPLLEALPSLDLAGIQWVIVGGESGPGWRPMDHDWARDLRDRCAAADIAFYFKQSAAPRTEMGMELDGVRIEEYPLEHPGDRIAFHNDAVIGRWTGRHAGDVTTLGTLALS